MGITGIIAEYNPFHRGHAYQLSEAKKFSSAIIAVMSGDFVQRGEFAVLDKWTRAEAALRSGVDMVIELPVVYSLSSAGSFAYGAVKLLDSLHIIDDLYFGSESDIGRLEEMSALLSEEEGDLSSLIKNNLSAGMSFPKARYEAAVSLYGPEKADVLTGSNDILALEYINAIRSIKSSMVPRSIKRTAEHDARSSGDTYTSALHIREMVRSGDDSYIRYIPENTEGLYKDFVFTEDCFTLLISKLREKDAKEKLLMTPDVSEGIENRIISSALRAGSYEELLQGIKSKRYPLSRIKRILMSFLIGITNYDVLKISEERPVARVLGIKKDSTHLLSLLSENDDIELVTNLPAEGLPRSLQLSLDASNIYGLFKKDVDIHNADYYRRFMII